MVVDVGLLRFYLSPAVTLLRECLLVKSRRLCGFRDKDYFYSLFGIWCAEYPTCMSFYLCNQLCLVSSALRMFKYRSKLLLLLDDSSRERSADSSSLGEKLSLGMLLGRWEGDSLGETEADGESLGWSEGPELGKKLREGELLGMSLGETLGKKLTDGESLGMSLGETLGKKLTDGESLGTSLGLVLGSILMLGLNETLGLELGAVDSVGD